MTRFFIVLFCLTIANSALAEFQFDIGYQNHDGDWDTGNTAFDTLDSSGSDYHFGAYVRNKVGKSKKHLIGIGLNVDSILDERLIGYRAIDYRYEITDAFQVGTFIGAANLDTGFQQSGYYLGVNAAYYFSKNIGLNFELNYGDNLARDRRSELGDPIGEVIDDELPRPDIFLNFYSSSLSLSLRF